MQILLKNGYSWFILPHYQPAEEASKEPFQFESELDGGANSKPLHPTSKIRPV
jgi:hypothetical protein